MIKNDATRYQQTNLADGLESIRNIIRKLELPTKTEPSPESIERQRRRYVNVYHPGSRHMKLIHFFN